MLGLCPFVARLLTGIYVFVYTTSGNLLINGKHTFNTRIMQVLKKNKSVHINYSKNYILTTGI